MPNYEKAKKCVKKLRLEWVLVLAEIALTGWTYYVYVWLMCYQTLQDRVEVSILLSVYHLLFILKVWCFLKTILTPRIPVPPEFHFDEKTWNQIELDSSLEQQTKVFLGVKTTTISNKTLNYCYICGNVKPDRCHHCSRCGTCVLRMDHHCPWVNRCVGFHNHKFFFLLIHYTFTYSMFLVITCTGTLPRIWRRDWVGNLINNEEIGRTLRNTSAAFMLKARSSLSEIPTAELTANATSLTVSKSLIPAALAISASAPSSSSSSSTAEAAAAASTASSRTSLVDDAGLSPVFIQVVAVIFIYLVIMISLVPLLTFHNQLLDGNITTLEVYRPVSLPNCKGNSEIFDLGSVSANHKQIMGSQLWLWPFPVFTSLGDGVHYPVQG